MRSLIRTARSIGTPLGRDVAAVASAVAVVAASFGAIAVTGGLSPARTVAMSLFVFAGGAQFLALGVVGAGGSAAAAVLAGLLLNARHLPFGLALGDTVGRSLPARLVGSHLMVDESVAFALARDDPAARRRAYWLSGSALFVAWNCGTVAGILAGGAVGDPAVLGIDSAFPAGLLALLVPALRDRPAALVAVAAAVLALATAPVLPPGLPVLVALLAVAVAAPTRRPGRAPAGVGGAGVGGAGVGGDGVGGDGVGGDGVGAAGGGAAGGGR